MVFCEPAELWHEEDCEMGPGWGSGAEAGGRDVLGDVSRQESVGLCLCQQGGRSLVVTAPTAQAPVVLAGWRARAIVPGCSQS